MTITGKRLELLGKSAEEFVKITSLNGGEGMTGTQVKILIDVNQPQ